MKLSRAIAAGLIIAIIGGAVSVGLMKTKPKAKRRKRPRMTPVVQCESIAPGRQTVTLHLLGTVVPARDVTVQARVSGEIVSVHPDWIEGGRIAKGETLVQIDPADYRIALAQAEADLAQAESELALEKGRQDVARKEWELLGDKGASAAERDLALRKPQLKATEARAGAAQARLERAKLDLERTNVKAPFNALVLTRHANLGDQAGVQSPLARLADADRFHVQVSLPVDELQWVRSPDGDGRGPAVTVALPEGRERSGRIVSTLSDLEPNSRMARLLVQIDDPLKQDAPLLLNSVVKVRIDGTRLDDCYAIDRDTFRPGSKVWFITRDKKLRIVPVEPLRQGRETVLFRAEIPEGARLITSALGIAIDGMDLRVEGEDKGEPPRKGAKDTEKKKGAKR